MSDKSFKSKEQYERMGDFNDYLNTTSKSVFNLFFSDGSIKQIPYKHRWTEAYRKGIMAKLYALDSWVKRHGLKFGMLSLTTAQAGLTDMQILEDLKKYWNFYRQTLNKMGFQYFLLYEPHESGIAHIHVLIIGDITDADIERLRSLWIEKYEMGNEHAFEFSADKKKDINSLVNYLMKYISKTVCVTIDNDDALMRFHSLFWQMGYRLWSSTNYFSYVMRMVKKGMGKSVLTFITMVGKMNGTIYERGISGFQVFELLKRCLKHDRGWQKPEGIVYGLCSPLPLEWYAELSDLRKYGIFTVKRSKINNMFAVPVDMDGTPLTKAGIKEAIKRSMVH